MGRNGNPNVITETRKLNFPCLRKNVINSRGSRSVRVEKSARKLWFQSRSTKT